MKTILQKFLFISLLQATAVFAYDYTNITYISATDTNYDGKSILITDTNAVFDGSHTFNSLTLTNGAKLTHTANTTAMANWLELVVTDTLAVSSNSTIDVEGKGYSEGNSYTNAPGNDNTGGSHGGLGGGRASDSVYGDFRDPNELGGGAGFHASGRPGGGLVHIVATNLVLNGTIVADGVSNLFDYYAAYGGGGAGGGVCLDVQNFSGTGSISASGGDSYKDGGGGGRIAVYYGSGSTFDFAGGISVDGGDGYRDGGAGTLYLEEQGSGGELIVATDSATGICELWLPAGSNYTGSIRVEGSTTVARIGDGVAGFDNNEVEVSGGKLILEGEHTFSSVTGRSNSVVEVNGTVMTPTFTLNDFSRLTHAENTATLDNWLDLEVSGTLTVSSNSAIDVAGRGYGEGSSYTNAPGNDNTGGSYGGLGGGRASDSVYGDFRDPNELGGGAGSHASGQSGGGLVRISASSLVLDGTIVADGVSNLENAYPLYGGGGAGGGIYLDVGQLSGSGTISADGGDSGSSAGGGGGGRVAVLYGALDGFVLEGHVSAMGGDGSSAMDGGSGTVYLTNKTSGAESLMISNVYANGTTPMWLPEGADAYSGDVLVRGGQTKVLAVQEDFSPNIIVDDGTLVVDGDMSFVDLTLTNGATLTHPVTTTTQEHWMELAVSGTLAVSSNSYIVADGLGYPSRFTYPNTADGRSDDDSGGSYGGYGGGIGPCEVYGDFRNPSELGSGGDGKAGGGLIRIAASALHLDGDISAVGTTGGNDQGGGSGGGICLDIGTLSGSGTISADGGDSGYSAGGGGGGRVAVLYGALDGFVLEGHVSAMGGDGSSAMDGGSGTVYLTNKTSGAESLMISNVYANGTTPLWLPVGADAYAGPVTVKGANTQVSATTSNFSPDIVLDGATMVVDGVMPFVDLTLTNGATLTHPATTTTQEHWMDLTVSGTLTVSSNSYIVADGLGYIAGYTYPNTTIGGSEGDSGGSYGGYGGNDGGTGPCEVYGDFRNPNELGSGGHSGKSGGGLIRIAASALHLDGGISANGGSSGNDAGGGSGGGIFLDIGTLSGEGSISANGGNCYGGYWAGAGGGGRVAVRYNSLAGFDCVSQVSVTGGGTYRSGGAGTLYLYDKLHGTERLVVSNDVVGGTTPLWLPEGADAYFGPVEVNGSNTQVEAVQDGFSPDIVLDDATMVVDGAMSFADLTLTNGAVLTHPAATVAEEHWMDLVVSGTLTVSSNSAVNADSLGYGKRQTIHGATPSSGDSGGSHGGKGGDSYGTSGDVYGDELNPVHLGSGSGSGPSGAGNGGGLIHIEASSIVLNGEISANGDSTTSGGSGGGIRINTTTLFGSGDITVNGGASLSGYGGGGGGRVAVYADDYSLYATNNITSLGGSGGKPGSTGSVYVANSLFPLQVAEVTPSGAQSSAVNHIDIRFFSPLQEGSFSLADLTLTGSVAGTILPSSLEQTGIFTWRAHLNPGLSSTNDVYTFIIGTNNVRTMLGGAMESAYTNTFYIDTELPPPPVVTNYSSVATNNLASTSITLEGTADADAMVWVNGTVEATTNGLGGWSATVNTLSQGLNTLYVTAKDVASNESGATMVRVLVDSIAPSITSLIPGSGSHVTNAPTVDITVADAISGFDADASDGTVEKGGVPYTGTWSYSDPVFRFTPSTPLADGVYSVDLVLKDNFGNPSNPTYAFTLDRVPPSTPAVDSVTSPTIIASQSITGTKDEWTAIYFNGSKVVSHNASTSWDETVSLTQGTNSYAVTAVDRAGNVSAPVTVEIVYDNTVPDPVELSINPEGNGMELFLSWTNYDETATGADIASYFVYQSGSSFSHTNAASCIGTIQSGNQEFHVTGLARNTNTYYAVVAMDNALQLNPSVDSTNAIPVDTVAPVDSTNMLFECSSNELVLTWVDSSDLDDDLTGYNLYTNDFATNTALYVSLTTNSCVVSNLAASSEYPFTLTAFDAQSPSNESSGLIVTGYTLLPNPVNLSITPYDGYVEMQWDEVQPSDYVDHYAVYMGSNDFTNVSNMVPVRTSTTNNAALAGLENGITNWFAITTVNKSGGETFSVIATDAATEDDMTGPELSNLLRDGLNPSLTISNPCNFTVSAYDPSGVGSVDFFIDDVALPELATTEGYAASWDVGNTPSNGNYTLDIIAMDTRGNVSTNTWTVNVALALPLAPEITSPSDWSYVSDDLVFVIGKCFGQVDGVSLQGTGITAVTNNVALDGTFRVPLSIGTGTNAITARAINRAGPGPDSNEIRVVLDSSVPGAPVGVAASPRADGQIRLSWFKPANAEVKYYQIFRSETSGVTTNNLLMDKVYTTVAYDQTTNNATYYYRVRAVSISGVEGSMSSEVDATSDDDPPMLEEIQFSTTGNANALENRYAPGTVTMTLKVSEELSADPFFTVKPLNGSPSPIDLNRKTATEYYGTYTINPSTPSGEAAFVFSARDKVGNWGTDVNSNIHFVVDTAGPVVDNLSIMPVAPIQNNSTSPVPVYVQLAFDASDLPVDGTLSLSNSFTQIDVEDKIDLSPAAGLENTWEGIYTLPADAGTNTENIVFHYQAEDDLGNAGTTINGESSFQIYQGTLPPLAVPQNLVATALPGGDIQLDWSVVEGASGYVVGHGTSSNGVSGHAATSENIFTEYAGDGTNWYNVASIRTIGSLSSTSAPCPAEFVVADTNAPIAPTNLVISSLTGAGIALEWEDESGDEVTYSLYRAENEILDVAGLSAIKTDITETNTVDSQPLQTPVWYAVTAIDEAGNESLPSANVSTNLSLVPVDTLVVELWEGSLPEVSWSHPHDDAIEGFGFYVEGSLITNLAKSVTNQTDSGYDFSTRTYGVDVFDDASHTSMVRTIALPQMSVLLKEESTLKRGIMNRLHYQVFNDSDSAVSNVTLQVEVGGLGHTSSVFNVSAQDFAEISVVVGGYTNLQGLLSFTNTLEIVPNPGELVRISSTNALEVGDGMLVVEILNEEFTRGGTGNARFVLHNTTEEEIEIITAVNGNASTEVRMKLENEDGMVLAVDELEQTTGNVLNIGNYTVARIPAGDSFTSKQFDLPVPQTADDNLVLRLEIDKFHWHATYDDQVSIRGMENTRAVSLVETLYAPAITNIDPVVSYGDTNIVITGVATNKALGTPLAYAEVKVIVALNGFDRTDTVYTDAAGAWSHVFEPQPGEGGQYQVYALHPDITARPAECGSFSVNRLKVEPSSFSLRVPKNYEQEIALQVTAETGMALTNLTVVPSTSLPSGVAITNANTLTLDEGQSGTLTFTIAADSTATNSGSMTFAITGDGAPNGSWASVPCSFDFSDAVPVLVSDLSYIETGVSAGSQVIESLRLDNAGYADALDLQLSVVYTDGNDAPNWVHLTGASGIDSLEAESGLDLSITLAPEAGTAPGQHAFYLRIESSNADTLDIPVFAGISGEGTGGAIIHVVDIYTGLTNELGTIHGLEGAKVQLISDIGFTEVNTLSSSNGIAEFNDLPVGSYKLRASADKHDSYIGRIWIKPGLMATEEVFLQNQLVTVEWSVMPTTIEDEYEIVLNTTFETAVPAPVIIVEPGLVNLPEMGAGDVFNGELKITNKGKIRGDKFAFQMPASTAEYRFEALATLPDDIAAGQIIRVPYRVTRVSVPVAEDGSATANGTCYRSYQGSACAEYKCVNGRITGVSCGPYTFLSPFSCGGGSSSSGWGVYIRNRGMGGPGDGGKLGGGVGLGDEPCEDPCANAPNPKCCQKGEPTGSSVYPLMGYYQDDATDLIVKVQGHTIQVARELEMYRHSTYPKAKKYRWNMLVGYGNVSLSDFGTKATVDDRDFSRAGEVAANQMLYVNGESRLIAYYAGDDIVSWKLIEADRSYTLYDHDPATNQGKPTKRVNRNGAELTFDYTNGFMTEMRDHYDNQVIWIERDAGGRITSVSDAETGGRTVGYGYTTYQDHIGSVVLSSVTNVMDQVQTYGYELIPKPARYWDKQEEEWVDYIAWYHLLISGKSSPGLTQTIAYDTKARVASVLDQGGRGKSFGYGYNSRDGVLYSRVTTSDGEVKERQINSIGGEMERRLNGALVPELPDNPLEPQEVKDEHGNVVLLQNPNGTVRIYRYEGPNGEMTLEINEASVTNRYAYDNRGNLTNQVQAVGTGLERTTYFVFDAVGNLREQTRVAGIDQVTSLMDYDLRGNLTNRVEAAGTTDERSTGYTYDIMGNLLTQTDALNNMWSNAYNAAGQLLVTINPLETCTVSNLYNAAGRLEQSFDAIGRMTAYEYDPKGHATNVVVSLGGTELSRIEREYNVQEQLLREYDALAGVETIYEYDGYGNLSHRVTSDGRAWSWVYDAYGRVAESVSPEGTNSVVYDPHTGLKSSVVSLGVEQVFEYDLHGNPTVVHTIADGITNTVEAVYDAQGNVVAQTDAEERTQRVLYDALGRSTGQVDAAGETNSVTYGFLGQVDGLVDANGNQTAWQYDPLGQLKTKTYDDNTQVHYIYDDAGRIQTKTDANGWHTKYAYDAVGNLLTNSFHATSNAAPQRTVVYAYDDLGRIKSYDDEVTEGTIVYDDANFSQTLTVTYTNGSSMTTEMVYDPVAREITKIYGGTTNVYAYGVDGKLEGVHIPGEGWVSYQYDERGLNDRIVLPGGVQRISEFDGLGRLKAKRIEDSGGADILTQAYQRSLTGSIHTKHTDAGIWTYEYDLIDQLERALYTETGSVTDEWEYQYDAMGNRTSSSEECSGGSQSRSYAPNNLNQYTSITSTVDTVTSVADLQYDLNGNLTNDGVRAYSWDLQNQLSTVEDIELVQGSTRVTYAYDAMGRRVSKSVYTYESDVWSPTSDFCYFYDGWNMVSEIWNDLSEMQSGTNYFVWGNDLSGSLQGAGGVGGLLCSVRSQSGSDPKAFYPLYDHNGNVEKYIRQNGQVVAGFQYDGFGNTTHEFIAQGLESKDFAYRFSTKYWDAETGLYYYGYRYYSPRFGRWIKRDPIGVKGGINIFAFVENNVVNRADYNGLNSVSPCDCYGLMVFSTNPNYLRGKDIIGQKIYTERHIAITTKIGGLGYKVFFSGAGNKCCKKHKNRRSKVDLSFEIGGKSENGTIPHESYHNFVPSGVHVSPGGGGSIVHNKGVKVFWNNLGGRKNPQTGDYATIRLRFGQEVCSVKSKLVTFHIKPWWKFWN